MTHSIASGKCQTVLSSGNYGMSQNRYTDDTKEYIFVKLTDSAFRAIEEYQRNDNAKRFAPGQRAKIQFVGKSGIIHFPLPDGNGANGLNSGAEPAGRKFGFAIDDVDGSIECIQQQQHDLDVLGSLALRMRIHANDDVYDTTRTKMAIAEETEKSKCIREIKPNQSDIGRKVKKAGSASSAAISAFQQQQHGGNNSNSSSSSYLSSSNNRSKLVSSPLNGLTSTSTSSSRSPNPTILGGTGTINSGSSNSNGRYGSGSLYSQNNNSNSSSNNFNNNNHHNQHHSSLPNLSTASSLMSTLVGGISHGGSSMSGNSPRESTSSSLSSTGNSAAAAKRARMLAAASGHSKSGLGGGSGSGNAKGNANSNAKGGGGKMSDVSRRNLRDRLIHLLALKPFKKPELYSRLQTEGLKDRERPLIINVLKDISTMSRDNTYNLRRQIWNDVDENWPFFSEQEIQQLKRRKPQNLTPPMSSDAGSSTSGQSPTSTHTGSPPPLVGSGVMGLGNGSSGNGNLKRPSLEHDESMLSGAQAKKQRISHYKKESGSVVNIGPSGRFSGGGSSYANNRGTSSSYSPHCNVAAGQHLQNQGSGVAGGGDEFDSGVGGSNSDLSYNVLDNVEFLSHIEQQSSNGSHYAPNTNGNGNGNSRKSSTNSNNAKQSQKQKRSSAGSSNSSNSSNGYEVQERKQSSSATASSSSSSKKTTTPPKPAYSSSFVPESSKTNGSNSRSNYAHQSSQRKNSNSNSNINSNSNSSNSVIFPSQVQTQNNSPRDEYNSYHSASNSKKRTSSNNSAVAGANDKKRQQNLRSGGSSSTNTASASKPPQQQQHKQQATVYQQVPPPNKTLQHLAHEPEPPPPPTQRQRQHPSPTQQLAAAAHSYASATSLEESTNAQLYDFSNYTPITTLEQRRRYKTEFENDYDEYRKLLELVENVRKRFQELAERLENARRRDTSDYNRIKQQIVCEYERINNQEPIQRDKSRFDYLHSKLAHIKQLVMDYDKTLTSGGGNGVGAAQQQKIQLQQQPQQLQQQQQQQYAAFSSSANDAHNASRLSPMVKIDSSSNYSPPLATQQQQQSSHYHQQQHYQQHHAAETIAQRTSPTSLECIDQRYNDGYVQRQQSGTEQSNNNRYHHQQQQAYEQQQLKLGGGNGKGNSTDNQHQNDSDSDGSSDASDSNDEDGEDSNSNSNSDDDDDNDHY